VAGTETKCAISFYKVTISYNKIDNAYKPNIY